MEGRYLGALEHIWYPTAVRIKRGALSHRQAEVIPADRRGADRGNRITIDSSKRKGPGCRTNQIDGLVDFVLRCLTGSRNRCRSVDTGREHRRRVVPVMLRVSCIPSRLLSYCLKKPLCIERRPPFQHGVYSTPELLGEDRQCLGFAVPADQSLVIKLAPFIFPEKKTGCFAEGPFQMDISDLVVCARLALAR